MPIASLFSPDLPKFLGELQAHNNKAWFEKNRERYARVYRDAFANFITELGPRLAKVSPYLLADPRPSGGSLMRIYRDVRFSPDKSPYRSYTVARFLQKEGEEGASPGLYLYVSPKEIEAGGGLWHPEPAVANQVRRAIAQDPRGWLSATRQLALRRKFEWNEDRLKRPPPGFPADHALIDELRRTSFVAGTGIPLKRFTSPSFLNDYLRIAGELSPLLRFLCKAVGLRY